MIAAAIARIDPLEYDIKRSMTANPKIIKLKVFLLE
jgi:hypothetical protein